MDGIFDESKVGLHARIDLFLSERKVSNGGSWAPVEKTEIDELHSIISELISLKYEEDADGDVPVEFDLVDRTRYYKPWVPYLTYTRPESKASEYMENVLKLSRTVENLADMLNIEAERMAINKDLEKS